MPEISRFFGIVIRMFFDEHNPPHIHAEYQGRKAVFDLAGNVMRGNLESRTATKLGNRSRADTEQAGSLHHKIIVVRASSLQTHLTPPRPGKRSVVLVIPVNGCTVSAPICTIRGLGHERSRLRRHPGAHCARTDPEVPLEHAREVVDVAVADAQGDVGDAQVEVREQMERVLHPFAA